MRQAVAYKKLKTIAENHQTSGPKSGRGHLWEVVAYERWSHMEVRLYFDEQHASVTTKV